MKVFWAIKNGHDWWVNEDRPISDARTVHFDPIRTTLDLTKMALTYIIVFFSGGLLWYCHVKRNTIDLQYPEPLLGKKAAET